MNSKTKQIYDRNWNRVSCTSGFTLIEILVVCVIIAILAGILLPAFSTAKKAAKTTISTSNLRQCYLSIMLYANDNDGVRNLPRDPIASNLLGNAPTCDPLDNWRSNCKHELGKPMVGSYAYAGSVFSEPYDYEWWPIFLSGDYREPIMVDIFASNNIVEHYVDLDPVQPLPEIFPDHVLNLYLDGHVQITHEPGIFVPTANGFRGFTWQEVFQDYR